MVDYYELLGVAPNASRAEIKSAYRSLARAMHPDAGGTSGTFQLLQEAYETLNDPVRREDYDRSRHCTVAPRDRASTSTTRARTGQRASRRREFGADPNYVPSLPKIEMETVSWWRLIDNTETIRFLPSRSPGHAQALGMLAIWPVAILPFSLVVAASPALLVLWSLLVVAAAFVLYWVARRHVSAHRADRHFAAEYGDRVVFGRPGGEGGHAGELRTAELLSEYLSWLPGVRIFHGLAWPGSVFADVDHAVLCGRRLVLIESKMWLPGHYTADESELLWRDGHRFRGGVGHLPEAITAFRGLLPELTVRGALLVYPNRAGEVTTGDSPDSLAPPLSPERFVHEIGEWLAEERGTLDRDALLTMLGQVVCPAEDKAHT